jgi:outer membrane protein assembly factor BamB
MSGPGTVYLLDLHGREVHRWELPYPPGLYGYLLPNGHLFYLGKIHDETWDRFPLWHRFKGGILLEVDWHGNVVWEYRDPNHHHDARRTPSGGAIYLAVERVPEAVATRVQGGVPGSAPQGMWADVLIEIDAAGQRLWEWHAYEHLNVDTDIITFNDSRDEWGHANTVVPLPEERVLVSFRNLSTVGIIDKRTGTFVWKLGSEVLAQQHDPSLLANGNILLFDNGAHRKDQAMPASRVLEVELTTNTLVWEYRDTPPYNFFSPFISGARRLPNGNTLITEGNFGRMFQVTPDKQVVWEYINPYFPAGSDGYRSTRYSVPHITWLRTFQPSGKHLKKPQARRRLMDRATQHLTLACRRPPPASAPASLRLPAAPEARRSAPLPYCTLTPLHRWQYRRL